jgi:uncharacterized protein (DUF1330 family)
MKARCIAAVSLLAGSTIGGVAVQSLHAQTRPPVYLVGEIEISDPDGYRRDYHPCAQALIKQHGGRAVAAANAIALVGEPPKALVTIYAWDSTEQLMGWFTRPSTKKPRRLGRSTRGIATSLFQAWRSSHCTLRPPPGGPTTTNDRFGRTAQSVRRPRISGMSDRAPRLSTSIAARSSGEL